MKCACLLVACTVWCARWRQAAITCMQMHMQQRLLLFIFKGGSSSLYLTRTHSASARYASAHATCQHLRAAVQLLLCTCSLCGVCYCVHMKLSSLICHHRCYMAWHDCCLCTNVTTTFDVHNRQLCVLVCPSRTHRSFITGQEAFNYAATCVGSLGQHQEHVCGS